MFTIYGTISIDGWISGKSYVPWTGNGNPMSISFDEFICVLVFLLLCEQALMSMKSSAILLPINLSRRGVEANAAISTIQSDILMCNLNIMSAILQQATAAGQAIAQCISQLPSASNGVLGWKSTFVSFCLLAFSAIYFHITF